MSLLARLIFFAIWFLNVQAGNETVVDGWVPEPTGRGTWSILWSCLATIFVCTWSALHLSVPKRHGQWYLLTRKLKWMFWAAVAPELILYISAQRFIEARDLSKYLVSDLGKPEWTLTQMQFACSGGFCIRTSSGQELNCSATQLLALIEKGDIDSPPIPEEELRSRGKSDLVIKIIAILQIIWFIVQTLVRAIQHYHITALEIVTVAFVLCSIFIYGFSMYQPQDVEFPVVLELQPAALAEAETTLKRDSDESNHALQDGGYVGMVLRVLSAALHNTTEEILNQSNHVGKRAGPTRYLRRAGVLSHIPRQATVPVFPAWTICVCIRSRALLSLGITVPNFKRKACLAHLLCHDHGFTRFDDSATSIRAPSIHATVGSTGFICHFGSSLDGIVIHNRKDPDYGIGIHYAPSFASRRFPNCKLERLPPAFCFLKS